MKPKVTEVVQVLREVNHHLVDDNFLETPDATKLVSALVAYVYARHH